MVNRTDISYRVWRPRIEPMTLRTTHALSNALNDWATHSGWAYFIWTGSLRSENGRISRFRSSCFFLPNGEFILVMSLDVRYPSSSVRAEYRSYTYYYVCSINLCINFMKKACFYKDTVTTRAGPFIGFQFCSHYFYTTKIYFYVTYLKSMESFHQNITVEWNIW